MKYPHLMALVCCLLLSACGPGKLFGPTITPTPSITLTRTSTPTFTPSVTPTVPSTSTLISTPTLTPAPKLPVLQSTAMPGLSALISPENSAKVVQIARWGMGNVNRLVFSPDGKHLAVPSSIGIYIFRVSDLAQESLIDSEPGIADLSYSPDGTSLIFTSGDSIKILDIATGQEIRTLRKEGIGSIITSALSLDGKVIAISFNDCSLRLWDFQTGEELRKFLGVGVCPATGLISFSADGSTLAAISSAFSMGTGSRGMIRIWNAASGELRFIHESNQLGSFALSPDGNLLALREDMLEIWDVRAQKLFREFFPSQIPGTSLAFSADGKNLTDGTGIWDTATWKQVTTLAGGGVLSPDWKLSAYYANSSISIRQTASGQELRSMRWNALDATNLTFSPDGLLLVSDAGSWNILTGQEAGYPPVGGAVGVAFSPDGKTIAILDYRGVTLIDKATGQDIHTHEDFTYGDYENFFFSPDGKFVIAGGWNSGIYTWDLTTWKTHFMGTKYGNCVAMSPDGKLLAYGLSWYGGGGRIEIMDPIKGSMYSFGSYKDSGISSITYSPDGKTLLSGSMDGAITIRNAVNGFLVRTFKAHTDMVTKVIYSPDGKLLASSSWDGTIKLWDVSTWQELVTLNGHLGGVSALTFSPDGKMIVSGSRDGTIRFWGFVP